MKKLTSILSFLLISSVTFATCPKADLLTQQKIEKEAEAKKLTTVADYLILLINEHGGDYENDSKISRLALETRTKSLRMATEAAKIEIQKNKEMLTCYSSK